MPSGNGKDPVASAQAAAEGVTLTGTVEFRGRSFRLGPCEAIAPMLDFAEAAAKGLDTDDPEGLAAMKAMLRDCFLQVPSCGACKACDAEDYDACEHLDLGDFPKFWRFVKAVRPPADELFEVVQSATEQAMARPTPARSGSSSPARSRSANSKAPSSSPGVPEGMPEAFVKAFEAGDVVNAADVLR